MQHFYDFTYCHKKTTTVIAYLFSLSYLETLDHQLQLFAPSLTHKGLFGIYMRWISVLVVDTRGALCQ